MIKSKLSLILIAVFMSVVAFANAADIPQLSMDELKQHLVSISEKTVEITGSFTALVANSETGTLEKAGYGKVVTTVSMSGCPLIVHRQEPNVLGVKGKKDDFYEFYSTIIYNGDYWLRAQDKQGNPGDLIDTQEATITKKVSPWIAGKDWLTGVCYLLPFTKISGNKIKSLLDVIKTEPGSIKMHKVTEGGQNYVALDFSKPPYQEEMVIMDPAHGLALKEYRLVINKGLKNPPEIVNKIVIKDFIDAGEGVWLPKSAELINSEGGKATLDYSFEVSKATVLAGKKIEDLVNFKLTKGWQVRDERFGTEFTVGDSPDAVLKQYDQIIKGKSGN